MKPKAILPARSNASLFAALLALLTLLGCPAILCAGPSTDALEQIFALEARLLDLLTDQYGEARDQEQEKARDLRQLHEAMDSALANRDATLDRLRQLNMDLVSASELAVARSRAATELRQRILAQLQRLEELGRRIRLQRDQNLVETEDLSGYWLIEIDDHGSGLLQLRLDGTLVSGSYRLDSGAQGSVRGIYTNHRLQLDRIDTVYGFESTLDGTHDIGTGELRGYWQAQDVSDGRSGYGDWRARKLAPGDEGAVVEFGEQ